MRNDPGFYAVDRAAMRDGMEELGDGWTALFFLGLSVDANQRREVGAVPRDLANYFLLPTRSVTAMLTTLAERGWIEWERPPNQYRPGRLTIVRDYEHVRTRRKPGPRGADAVPTRSRRGGLTDSRGATRENATHTEHRTQNTEQPGLHVPADSHRVRENAEAANPKNQEPKPRRNVPTKGPKHDNEPRPLTTTLDYWKRQLNGQDDPS